MTDVGTDQEWWKTQLSVHVDECFKQVPAAVIIKEISLFIGRLSGVRAMYMQSWPFPQKRHLTLLPGGKSND